MLDRARKYICSTKPKKPTSQDSKSVEEKDKSKKDTPLKESDVQLPINSINSTQDQKKNLPNAKALLIADVNRGQMKGQSPRQNEQVKQQGSNRISPIQNHKSEIEESKSEDQSGIGNVKELDESQHKSDNQSYNSSIPINQQKTNQMIMKPYVMNNRSSSLANSKINSFQNKDEKKSLKDVQIAKINLTNERNAQEVKDKSQNEQKGVKRVSSVDPRLKKQLNLPNVDFYQGMKKSNNGYGGEFVEKILARKGNYRILEMDHAYIQWIFPNKFQSQFNSDSLAITDEEIKVFLTDRTIADRYVQAYEMMLDFYGIEIVSKMTGELKRATNYLTRYKEAITGHNCLRIRRILTSLNNLGFRKYAIQLVDFLAKEIYFSNDKPLAHHDRQFKSGWVQYGRVNSKQTQELLEKNAFAPINELERESIYFSQWRQNRQQQVQQQEQVEEEEQKKNYSKPASSPNKELEQQKYQLNLKPPTYQKL